MSAATNLTAGATDDEQHHTDEQQDDADSRKDRNRQQRSEKKQNQSSNNHAELIPRMIEGQTRIVAGGQFFYCCAEWVERDITAAGWPADSTCAITCQPRADQKSA